MSKKSSTRFANKIGTLLTFEISYLELRIGENCTLKYFVQFAIFLMLNINQPDIVISSLSLIV
jgi:hypothetical protein